MSKSNELHPFIMISIPKSGTHLLKQILLGIPGMKHHPDKGMFGPFSNQPKLQLSRTENLEKNEFVNGHLFCSDEWDAFFSKLNMKKIFVMRDPRDVVVSYAYFIPTLPIHPLYETFTQEGFTHRDRIKFLIKGGEPITPNKPYQPNVEDWYTSFSEWKNRPNVFTIRFEDLISSERSRIIVLHQLVKFLWGENPVPTSRSWMVGNMIKNIDPDTSPTFRKGAIGGWQEEFDLELKELFKKESGNLLQSLGYEKNSKW
ncbi:sulfotransferase domain-containing protein [Guptibacillus algicola]|uniref:sulfotransferase domain-containing protein n=1 Tax=Guptibacillus algicola TaxID=225844 RepID=UPI001CD3EDB5|nr:sulfotransferase domain-containing protein [Alkalihalobacillus algicola]MCA0987856.1 sulfotransferase domain-containing protein [Alkalihalobacillus algicola]